jgi:hypothetical protein
MCFGLGKHDSQYVGKKLKDWVAPTEKVRKGNAALTEKIKDDLEEE